MKKKVVIIGGGILGLSSAYYLTKYGASVTILEKDEFGQACTKGNLGWVFPAIHAPVPEPGLILNSIKWVMKKDSPLFIKPSALPQISGWLKQFMKFCNEESFKQGQKALLTLSKSTNFLYDELEIDGVEFEMHRNGMLFLFLNSDDLNAKYDQLRYTSELYGHEIPKLLSGDEIRRMEPFVSDKVTGGIYLENQRHVDPEKLAKGFINKLKTSKAELKPSFKVTDVEVKNNKITAVICNQERIEGDIFLFSSGVWSGTLLNKLGYTLPVQPGKGYSITFTKTNMHFNRPLYFGDTKAGLSPFHNAVRIGGTMEFSGLNNNIDKERIKGIKKAVSMYLKTPLKGENDFEWMGMRSMTPDGLPVLGKVPTTENAFIATGHNMIGIALAPVSGKAIAELILNGETEYNIDAFTPERFLNNFKVDSKESYR